MKLLTLLITLSYCFQLIATSPTEESDEVEGGIHIGNGGKVLHCHKDDTYRLLDYYELSNTNILAIGKKAESPLVKAELALDRIRQLDPVRYKRLNYYLENFMTETRFISDQKLGGISDTGLVNIPRNCNLIQAAVQMPVPGSSTRYSIDSHIWSQLSSDHKAGLILHEIIYRDFARGSSHNTSYYVRQFVRKISNPSLRSYDLKMYLNFLKSLYVEDYNYNGTKISLQSSYPVIFFNDSNNKVRNAPLVTPQTFNILGKKLTTHSKGQHRFYYTGQLIGLTVSPDIGEREQELRWQFKGTPSTTLAASIQEVLFDSNGAVSNLLLSKDLFKTQSLWINKRPIRLIPNSRVIFNTKSQRPVNVREKDKPGVQLFSTTTIRLRDDGYYRCKKGSCVKI